MRMVMIVSDNNVQIIQGFDAMKVW